MSLNDDIMKRMQNGQSHYVWAPNDFSDLGKRDAIDQALKRLTKNVSIRRIERGLYDLPRYNLLTKSLAAPDYRKVIAAVSRREHIRMLVDGLTAANNLGLTNAVPGQVIILTDGRLRPIQIDNLTIQFKKITPSKLVWCGRPAVDIVQALFWLRDVINHNDIEVKNIELKLLQILFDPKNRLILVNDLVEGLYTLPDWMQIFIKKLLANLDSMLQG